MKVPAPFEFMHYNRKKTKKYSSISMSISITFQSWATERNFGELLDAWSLPSVSLILVSIM